MFSSYSAHSLVNDNTLSTVKHIPVLGKEAIKYLAPVEGNTIVDMTFGAGGHTEMILEAAPNVKKIICLDRDPHAYCLAETLKQRYPSKIVPCLGSFSELPKILKTLGVQPETVDGFLFDLGCSSSQFDDPSRGFSISKSGPLDMRMNPDDTNITAGDVLKWASEEDLVKIFKVYGEEKHSKKIARAIIESRYLMSSLKTTDDLAKLVKSVCPESRFDSLDRLTHVATKVFQALRIFVNNELNEINAGMFVAHKYLKLNGRLVAISFHSLEDKIVKGHINGSFIKNGADFSSLQLQNADFMYDLDDIKLVQDKYWFPVNKHVVRPTNEEIEYNPRSRSGKLRAAIKIK